MMKAPRAGGGRCAENILKGKKNNNQQDDPAMRADHAILSCRLHDAHLFRAPFFEPGDESRKKAQDKGLKIITAGKEPAADEIDRKIQQYRDKAETPRPVYVQIQKTEKKRVKLYRQRTVQRIRQDK